MGSTTDLRFMRVVPIVGSVNAERSIRIQDAPAGLTWDRRRIKPIFARRLQSGALITQIPRYNKNGFGLSGTLWEPSIEEYFVGFYNNNESFLVELPKINSQVLEYSGIVHILSFGTGYDFTNNLRTIDLDIEEV
jgi:hypothetical protein